MELLDLYGYGCIKSNGKAIVNNGCGRHCDCNVLEVIVTFCD